MLINADQNHGIDPKCLSMPIDIRIYARILICIIIAINSLEAKHLIWVWIMKVKGPKNQADFIEVLYVVVNSPNTEVIPIGSKNWRPLGVTGPPKDENYTWFHWAP